MKQRSDSKVTRKKILKGLAQGKTRSQIAKECGCVPSAVTKQLKMLINDDYVRSYDSNLGEILKSASMTFINDSLHSTKRQKASMLQCVTAAGILIDKQRNTPPAKIDINIIQGNISQSNTHLETINENLSKVESLSQDIVIDVPDDFIKKNKALEINDLQS